MRRLILTIAASALASMAVASEPSRIEWPSLVDEAAQSYEDPYRDLSYDQLDDLRSVVRLRARLEGGEVAEDTRPRLETRLAEAEAALEASGIDIAWLLDQRWVVAERRETAANAGNPEVDGRVVALAGFAIPAPPDDDGTPMAYLVPERGMCSHTPPPPPNQMVRLRLTGDWTPTMMHEPVLVSGQLAIAPSSREMVVVDGPVQMNATFAMQVDSVETAAQASPAPAVNTWAQDLAERLRASGQLPASEERNQD